MSETFQYLAWRYINCCFSYTICIVLCRTTHSTKKPVTTMLTYPWKCTVLHCNHLGNTWKPLVLMTRHFDYCPSASNGDGGGAWWLLAFLHSDTSNIYNSILFCWCYEPHSPRTVGTPYFISAPDCYVPQTEQQ